MVTDMMQMIVVSSMVRLWKNKAKHYPGTSFAMAVIHQSQQITMQELAKLEEHVRFVTRNILLAFMGIFQRRKASMLTMEAIQPKAMMVEM